MSSRGISLRTRLTLGAVAGAAITLTILVAGFNLVLDARLRADGDNVLRERAATALRGLATIDGRLSVIEAPDEGAIDTQTWVFAGEGALERPSGADARAQAGALALSRVTPGFSTPTGVDVRLYGVPVRRSARRLGAVVVGASTAPYESTSASALRGSIALGVVALLAVAALSRWLIRRALGPVARMTAQAAEWGEHDVSRRFFAGRPHDELSTLASVFDALLSRLAAALRREQQLTAEVSHELRTPLAKIRVEAELAQTRERSTNELRVSLASVQRHAGELERVLETLLASARSASSAGRHVSDAKAAALAAAESVRDSLASAGKRIAVACGDGVGVGADAEVVERILSPLIENAARFAATEVRIEVRKDGEEVIFAVLDDGPGVDARDVERIFQAGVRGGADAGDDRGAGLGLSLARRLAGSAGGSVEALVSEDGGLLLVRMPRA